MTPLLTYVLYSAILTWLSIIAAAEIRSRGWTVRGLLWSLSNRDQPHGEPASALAQRADRAAANTVENFILFAAIALVAHASGVQAPKIALGAQVFFWARLVYLPLYYLGVPYVRTGVWGVGVVGMAMIVFSLL